jgi:hypothetical protein
VLGFDENPDVCVEARELLEPDSLVFIDEDEDTEEGGDGSLALGFITTGMVKSGGFGLKATAGCSDVVDDDEKESERPPDDEERLLELSAIFWVVPLTEGNVAEGCSLA